MIPIEITLKNDVSKVKIKGATWQALKVLQAFEMLCYSQVIDLVLQSIVRMRDKQKSFNRSHQYLTHLQHISKRLKRTKIFK